MVSSPDPVAYLSLRGASNNLRTGCSPRVPGSVNGAAAPKEEGGVSVTKPVISTSRVGVPATGCGVAATRGGRWVARERGNTSGADEKCRGVTQKTPPTRSSTNTTRLSYLPSPRAPGCAYRGKLRGEVNVGRVRVDLGILELRFRYISFGGLIEVLSGACVVVGL
jgi:hypothetical protein